MGIGPPSVGMENDSLVCGGFGHELEDAQPRVEGNHGVGDDGHLSLHAVLLPAGQDAVADAEGLLDPLVLPQWVTFEFGALFCYKLLVKIPCRRHITFYKGLAESALWGPFAGE